MERRPLGRTGIDLSILGYGASPLGNEFGAIDVDEGRRSVHLAIDLGVNIFDVAPYYGRTLAETVLGEALAGRRDEIFLSSKVGRYDKAAFDFTPATILAGLEATLRRLKTDHLDLVIAHDIEFAPLGPILAETIPALEKAKAQGKVRAIGVSGLPLAVLTRALAGAKLDFVLSYCHYTLNDTSLETVLAPIAAAAAVGLINAAPLAMGLLTQAGPPAWHPGPEALKIAARRAAEACGARRVDLATLALGFSLKAPFVATTIVGMPTTRQVRSNVAAVTAPIDDELLAEVRAVFAPVADLTWPSGLAENQ